MFRNKLFVFMTAGIIGLAMVGGRVASAHEGHDHEGAGSAATAETANKGESVTCPVSGEAVDSKTALTYTYKGEVYHFCCASCLADFKKDPEKYIRKMKDDAAKAKVHDHHE